MAVTKIIPIRFTIEKSVSYICNPHKTGDCLYIHSEHCVPQTAALTFQHHLGQARAGGNTIGRHLIQSFAPGEVNPETAHEIGKKLADEILGGRYAYVMATHIDRGHVHNHFVWGAADVESHKKYHSNKRTYHDIRAVSDRLCEEHNLSVIVPQGVGKSYTEYHAEKQGASWKAKLKAAVDTILSESADFDDFLRHMEAQGYEVKKGTHISFRASGQTRFTRAKTLGADYTEDALQRRISEKSKLGLREPLKPAPLQSVIDIEGNERIKSSPGYRQWAAVFNLKQSAAALNLVQQYGGINAFDEIYGQAISDKMELAQELNAMDADKRNLVTLRNHLRAYGRTKEVYSEFQNQKSQRRKESFYAAHESEILAHREAKKALSKAAKPVPSVKAITTEMERLRVARADVQVRYKQSEAQLKEMEIVRKNLYSLTHRGKDREQSKSNDLSM
jgi:phosphopantetheinyl transferase (holo-ACP synthase)